MFPFSLQRLERAFVLSSGKQVEGFAFERLPSGVQISVFGFNLTATLPTNARGAQDSPWAKARRICSTRARPPCWAE